MPFPRAVHVRDIRLRDVGFLLGGPPVVRWCDCASRANARRASVPSRAISTTWRSVRVS